MRLAIPKNHSLKNIMLRKESRTTVIATIIIKEMIIRLSVLLFL